MASETSQYIRLRESLTTINIVHDEHDENKNRENITLIWYDTKTVDENNTDVTLTKKCLREIANCVQCYHERDPCLNYIQSISKEKVFLVMSGSLSERDMDLFHRLKQIEAIFIFCFQRHKYLQLKNKFSRIADIYTEQNELLLSIKEQVRHCDLNMTSFNHYQLSQKHTRNLNRECGSFIFFQLFKEVINHMPKISEAKSKMIHQCRIDYKDSEKELEQIQKFENEYTANDAIKWYTDDTFIYRIINKGLRTEDIDTFLTYRFFISDLSRQLALNHSILKKKYKSQRLTVYRGMKLPSDEIENMRGNIHNLLFSLNGFMSCSRTRNIAYEFMLKGELREGYERVLLEIEIDMKQFDKIIFADVEEISQFGEHEILFDIGKYFIFTYLSSSKIYFYSLF